MKRQIEKIRAVLLDVEESTKPVVYHRIGYPFGAYHAGVLASGGYLIASPGEDPDTIVLRGLTWSGCKLLDQLRNEEILEQAQDAAQATVGDRDNLEIVLRYIERFTTDA